MRKNKGNGFIEVAMATVVSIGVFSMAFIGVNNLAFAAATQPEQLAPVAAPVITAPSNSNQQDKALQSEYKEPNLTVIMHENLDKNGKPYPNDVPSANAISYKEAAKIGAKYIWDMYGESIDGKTVKMSYSAYPHSSKTYWHGTVANSEEDLKIPENYETYPVEEGATMAASNIVSKALFDFSIDAVTGERVSINPNLYIPETEDLGEGKTYTLSPVQMEALQYKAPANVDEYADAAREFAQKHFNHSKVASVDFVRISLNQGNRAASVLAAKTYREAYQAGKDKPFTFTLYEKGRGITFTVTDDTGRVADVSIDMDSKQVIYLDTTDSDFIPGFNADAPGAVG